MNVNVLKDYAASFAGVVLALFVADGADITKVDASDFKSWIAAGLGAVLPPVIAALDKKNLRYGLKGK